MKLKAIFIILTFLMLLQHDVLAGRSKKISQLRALQTQFKTNSGYAFNTWLFPIGFSRKGLFAYVNVISSCSESDGGTSLLIIKDLDNDKNIHTERFRLDNLEDEKQILSILKQNDIQLGTFWVAGFYTLLVGSSEYSGLGPTDLPKVADMSGIYPQIERKVIMNGPMEEVVDYKLYLVSQSKGKKLVAALTQHTEDSGAFALYAVPGYFSSPFENRIALITEGWERYMEGCRGREIRIYGAKLNAGFQK